LDQAKVAVMTRFNPEIPQSAGERRNRLIAIGLMCGAVLCFAGLDATVKWLSDHVDPLQTVWARYMGGVLIVSIFVNYYTTPGVSRTMRPWLQAARSLLLLGYAILNFTALKYLQLAETISIQFATPFLVALLAGPMLGEWVGPRRMIAICVGFLGVVIVTRPGFGGLHPAAILSFGSAFCYALYGITTRMLAATDSSRTTMFYSGLAGVALMTPVLPFVWASPESPFIWLLLGSLGFYGAFGHWLLILAHARAPAPILAPFIYTQLLWMLALGYLVFSDLPDRWTILGAGVVVASGLYLLYRENISSHGSQ
jgi:drug/metabolite transporter (DMT)-like permease